MVSTTIPETAAAAARYSASGRDFTPTTHSTTYAYISPLNLNLTGKNIVYTGTAYPDGVGYATATAFARAGAFCIALADLQRACSEIENCSSGSRTR
jgi:hypothetical protein